VMRGDGPMASARPGERLRYALRRFTIPESRDRIIKFPQSSLPTVRSQPLQARSVTGSIPGYPGQVRLGNVTTACSARSTGLTPRGPRAPLHLFNHGRQGPGLALRIPGCRDRRNVVS
jgi:hypothetical protein